MREEISLETSFVRFARLKDFDGDNASKVILYVTLLGDQDTNTVEQVLAHTRIELDAYAPVLFLNDMSQIGETSMSARWQSTKDLKRNRPFILKSAVYGVSDVVFAGGTVLLRVAGRQDIRLFKTKDEAIAWLLED